jgi:GT2 family glycosyltransferase
MDISIIIVSWNVKDILRQNLHTLLQTMAHVKAEVFVVDNASADGSAQMVREEFPQVKLIANDENLGFAKANNLAIKQAQGKYILLLNPDMRVFDDTLDELKRYMDTHPYAGVVGAKLLDDGDNIVPHVRRFPTVWDQAAIILKLPHVYRGILNRYLMTDFDYDKEAMVDSIRGSFFCIRREMIEQIGGLDERYFIWFEEVDYCREVIRAGYRIMYTPHIRCHDFVGQSFSQVGSLRKQKMFTESMITYFKKWHRPWQSLLLQTVRPIGYAIVWGITSIKKILNT